MKPSIEISKSGSFHSLVLACGLALGIGLACAHAPKPVYSPIPIAFDGWVAQPEYDELYCEGNDDCTILERPDCCGCSAGGIQGPISKKYRAAVEAKIAAECTDVACPDVMSGDLTCIGVKPACVDNTCHLMRRE